MQHNSITFQYQSSLMKYNSILAKGVFILLEMCCWFCAGVFVCCAVVGGGQITAMQSACRLGR